MSAFFLKNAPDSWSHSRSVTSEHTIKLKTRGSNQLAQACSSIISVIRRQVTVVGSQFDQTDAFTSMSSFVLLDSAEQRHELSLMQ